MVSVYTHHLESLGSRVEVAALRDTAKLEERTALVNYASRFAAFASGIHKIDRCWPRYELLADQTRRKKGKVTSVPAKAGLIR